MKRDFTSLELKEYWNRSAENIKPYHDAPSTQIYFEQEKRLIHKFFSPLKGKTFLKTDLWNETKNTQILRWILKQEAKAYGMDISDRIVQEAYVCFNKDKNKPYVTIADLREIPFPNNYFDFIYSMGTLEHFIDYKKALCEMARVLKIEGKAIIGVPNKLDPFLRPIFIFLMQRMGLYPFGFEKSFSKKKMIQLLKNADFKIIYQSSLLFMPGFLRILDLFFYCHLRPLVKYNKVLMTPFVSLYNHFKFFRSHGYLIAFIVEKRKK